MVNFRKISGLVLLSAFMLGVNSGHLVGAKKISGTVSKGTSVPKVVDSKTNSSKNSGGNLDAGAVAAPKKEVMKPVTKLAESSVSKDDKVTGDIGFAQGVGIASGTAGMIGAATSVVKKSFEKNEDILEEGSKEIETNDNEDNGNNNSKTKDNQTDSSSSGSKTASMVVMYVAIAILVILIFIVVCIATSGKCCIQGVCSCC